MVGITNAGGSAGTNHIQGTVSYSTKTTSLSVTGVGFNVKYAIVFIRTSTVYSTYKHLRMVFADVEGKAVRYLTHAVDNSYQDAIASGGSISQSGTTVTISAPSDTPFANGSAMSTATFEYHLFG